MKMLIKFKIHEFVRKMDYFAILDSNVMCLYLSDVSRIEPDTVTCEHGLLDVFKPYYAVLNHFCTGMLKTYFMPHKTHP